MGEIKKELPQQCNGCNMLELDFDSGIEYCKDKKGKKMCPFSI